MKAVIITLVLLVLGEPHSNRAVLGGKPGDWPMLGRTSARNPVVQQGDAPIDWHVKTGRNVKWSSKLGSQTYGTPVITDGQVYVGTNNGASYLER